MNEKGLLQKQITDLYNEIKLAKADLYLLCEQYKEKYKEDFLAEVILLEPPKKKRGRPKKIKEIS